MDKEKPLLEYFESLKDWAEKHVLTSDVATDLDAYELILAKNKRIQKLTTAISDALHTIDDPFNLNDETIRAKAILESVLTEDKE